MLFMYNTITSPSPHARYHGARDIYIGACLHIHILLQAIHTCSLHNTRLRGTKKGRAVHPRGWEARLCSSMRMDMIPPLKMGCPVPLGQLQPHTCRQSG